jgi:hypothetical protein
VGWRSASFVVLALAAGMALAVPAAAAGATAPGSASPVFLDIRLEGAALSFSAAELAAAVGLRLTLTSDAAVGATPVVVTSPSPGQVAIASGWRRREIDVADAPAAEAARLVALMIVDLVRPEVALPPPASVPAPPPKVASPTAAATPPSAAASAAVAARAAPSRSDARLPPRLTLAAAMGIAARTTDAGASASPTVEVRLALGSRARLVLAAAFDHAEALVREGDMQSTLAVTTLPVRLGVGARLGFVEVRAGGLVRTYLASGLASRGGAVGGMFAAVAVELPLGSTLVPFGVVGVDVHPQAVAFQVAGQTVLELGRFAPWLAVGLAWRGRTA